MEECNPCKLNCEEISYYRYWLTKIRQSAPAFREPIDDELTGGKFVPSFSASLSLPRPSLSVRSTSASAAAPCAAAAYVCTRASQHTRLVFESWRLPPPDACFSLAVVVNATPATEKKKFAILVKGASERGRERERERMDGSENCSLVRWNRAASRRRQGCRVFLFCSPALPRGNWSPLR